MTSWALLVAAALAAPPQGLDLEDIGHWAQRSDAILAGPAGCWELEGQARVKVAVFTSGGLMGPPQRLDTLILGPFGGRDEGDRA